MSSPDAIPGLPELLAQAGVAATGFTLAALSGGKNNQVYRLDRDGHEPLVLKRYFHSAADPRDRFRAEHAFYGFIRTAGIESSAPCAVAWNEAHRLGLFSWIDGHRLQPEEVTTDAVDQALAFYFGLNAQLPRLDTVAAPIASEACFTLSEHFATVERRLTRLGSLSGTGLVDHAAAAFVHDSLLPAFHHHRSHHAAALNDSPLPADRRCLSPSDFGFHNGLRQADGRIAFFDFEYAGWDDPAKFLCDFLCQPAVPVPQELWPHCIDAACQSRPGGTTRDRIDLLLPLYHLKWCCILLNEFLVTEQQRRAFSGKLTAADLDSKKQTQLDKARQLLEKCATLD